MSQSAVPPQAMDTSPVDTPQQQQQQQQQPPVNDRKRPAETSTTELEKNTLEEQLKDIARLKELERKIKERGVNPDDLLDTFDKSQREKEEAKIAEAKTMLAEFEQDVLPVIPENEREAAKLEFANYLKNGDQNAFRIMRVQTAANHRNRQMHLEVEARLKQANKQLEEERAARQELEQARLISQAFASTLHSASHEKPKSMMNTWASKFNSVIDEWAGISKSSTAPVGQTSMELDNPFAIRQPSQTVPVPQQQQQTSSNVYSVGSTTAPQAQPQSQTTLNTTQPTTQTVTTTASAIDPTDGLAYIRKRFMDVCAKEFDANGPVGAEFNAGKYALVNEHFEKSKNLCLAPRDKYMDDYRDIESAGITKIPQNWRAYSNESQITGYFIQ